MSGSAVGSPARAAAPSPPLLRPDSLATAVVLSANAGFLDAFAYVGHGHVFASFVTGNMVLLGIYLAGERSIGLYVLPIVAYVAGVVVAQVLMRERVRHVLRGRSHLAALAVEIATFGAVARLAHNLDDHLLVPLITFTTAVQNTMFRNLGARTYNSAFMTGNLQVLTGAILAGLTPPSAAKLAEARDLGAVILGFTGGAFGGALLTPRFHLDALFAPAALLATLALALLVARPRARRSGSLALPDPPG